MVDAEKARQLAAEYASVLGQRKFKELERIEICYNIEYYAVRGEYEMCRRFSHPLTPASRMELMDEFRKLGFYAELGSDGGYRLGWGKRDEVFS